MDADTFPAELRVLAVDDDPVCLKILERQLKYCNYNATVVSDARTALDMLREKKDGNQFDLVISDIVMPNMDGFKLLELIGLEMDLPVISKAGPRSNPFSHFYACHSSDRADNSNHENL
ncbi:unnamed protein product [Miscanthus lutarioriparius]|uniref:Response regulatory domain-containing protein n=1 Tax=Miscanthus lutarioriparius TaxID=422564 RepID=A0A811RDH6_9POAL|nr:unnamed protein product [Miscanthus lutarioriparius]